MSHATPSYAAADTRYIASFDAGVSPARLHLAVTLAGAAWAPRDRDRLSVLDIGCGRGLTAIMLAAANPGWDVTGIDLQPAHIAEAEEVAADAGLDNARFMVADLAGFDEARAARLLPEADIVLCYGVWTWVPDAVRAGIVEVLRSRVKPGGLVVMGYNAMPGHAPFIALQRLLYDAVRDMPGSAEQRAAHAIDVLDRIRAIGSPHLPPAPELDAIIARAKALPNYMAHEWFTGFWRPVFPADLARDLAEAQIDYAGPVRPASNRPEFQLRPEQQAALAALPPWMDAETRLDAFLQRHFRNEIFVRGRRPPARGVLEEVTLALGGDPAQASVSLKTRAGVAALPKPQQAALIDALAGGPKRVGDLAALPEVRDIGPDGIALMLAESFTAHPLWRHDMPDAEGRARAARTNRAVARHVLADALPERAALGVVAPLLGSGFPASTTDLAVVTALQAGVPAEPAALAAAIAPGEGPDGPLSQQIAARLALHLEAWRALGIV